MPRESNALGAPAAASAALLVALAAACGSVDDGGAGVSASLPAPLETTTRPTGTVRPADSIEPDGLLPRADSSISSMPENSTSGFGSPIEPRAATCDGGFAAAAPARAQFAFVGTVTRVDERVHPWTVDPENPDRSDDPDAVRWVTFAVHGWYTDDWGERFSVWAPALEIEPGERLAVGGDAYHIDVLDFSGQSGEIELCVRLGDSATSVAAWDDEYGPPVVPGSVEPVVESQLAPDKVFGVHDGPCRSGSPVPPRDGADASRDGPACFVREFEAGRSAVWDHMVFTVEGAPIPSRYAYDGRTVSITRDYSFDGLGPGRVEEHRCAAIVLTLERGLEGVDCTVGQGSGFGPESILVDPEAP